IGLELARDTTIPDDIPTIGTCLAEAFSRVNLVFVSGGLGPTVDDITRDALALALNLNIVLHQPTVENITKRYAARGRTMTPAAKRQALVLENAVILPNSVGTAPGQRIGRDGKFLFVLPGPPSEFNAILNEEIVPWLNKKYEDARPDIIRSLWTTGIYESDIVTLLEKEHFDPANVDLGFYPANGKVEIRITATPNHEEKADEAKRTLLTLLSSHIDDQ
ncbi:MAG: molybdopterin-binding protein, partial [Kiritimatiellaceae bacterium]|nr:molybdopterin-binding protein [Kiritimatiellaceae bacterium]